MFYPLIQWSGLGLQWYPLSCIELNEEELLIFTLKLCQYFVKEANVHCQDLNYNLSFTSDFFPALVKLRELIVLYLVPCVLFLTKKNIESTLLPSAINFSCIVRSLGSGRPQEMQQLFSYCLCYIVAYTYIFDNVWIPIFPFFVIESKLKFCRHDGTWFGVLPRSLQFTHFTLPPMLKST